jgi:hypothetical protein
MLATFLGVLPIFTPPLCALVFIMCSKSNPIVVFALDLMSTYEGEHTIFGLLGQANFTLTPLIYFCISMYNSPCKFWRLYCQNIAKILPLFTLSITTTRPGPQHSLSGLLHSHPNLPSAFLLLLTLLPVQHQRDLLKSCCYSSAWYLPLTFHSL